MDLAQATNAPERLTLAGREYEVRSLTLAQWGELCAWLKRAKPSPVTEALRALRELAELGTPATELERDALLTHAQLAARTWPPTFGGYRWLDALAEADGGDSQFIGHVLRCNGHDVDDQAARAIAKSMTQDEFNDLIRVAYFGDPPGPKSPAAPASPSLTPRTIGAPSSTSSPSGSATPRLRL